MTIDADKWSERGDSSENGDMLGLNLRGDADSSGTDSRGQKKEELKTEKVATDRPLENTPNPTAARPPIPPPDRYITIRRPPVNANRGKGTLHLVFLRCTTVGLVLLCILLLGGLLSLTIYSPQWQSVEALCNANVHQAEQWVTKDFRLHEIQMLVAHRLIQENQNLKKTIDDLRINISSTDICSTGHALFILYHQMLEVLMKGESLYLDNKTVKCGSYSIPFSWNCTSNSP